MSIQLSKQGSNESGAYHPRNSASKEMHSHALAVAAADTSIVEEHSQHHAPMHHATMTQTHHSTTSHPSYYDTHASNHPSHHHSTAVVSHHGHHGSGRIISTVTGEARETGQTHIIATRTGEKRYTGETRVVETVAGGSHQIDTRVVGVERGAERQISVTEVAIGEEIIGERTVPMGKGRRGRKIIREEVIEKVIVVPETVQIEEWVEDEYDLEETVIEVAKKIQIEKTVEVPEVEIVENVIEQIEKVIREKVVEVPKIQTVERIVEVPLIQTVERIVEVPEVQYRDVPVEKIVEVPEYQTEEVIREVKKTAFVDKPVEQKILIVDDKIVECRLPVPVEAETIVEFTVPHLRANYIKKKFPVYLPRFIEVPVSRQFVDAEVVAKTEKYAARLANLISVKPAVSLCEIEGLASEMKIFFDEHKMQSSTALVDAPASEHAKKDLFGRHAINLEAHAPYRHLPVEVAEVHVGHYHQTHAHGTAITFSSHTFGLRRSGSQQIQHSTTSHRPIGYTSYGTSSVQHTTGTVHHGASTAYKVGHAVGSIAGAINRH